MTETPAEPLTAETLVAIAQGRVDAMLAGRFDMVVAQRLAEDLAAIAATLGVEADAELRQEIVAIAGVEPAITDVIERIQPLARDSAGAGLDELRALSDAATPGEWASGGDEVYAGEGETYSEICRMLADWGDDDAAFIVAAINYVRAALSAPQKETKP